MTYKDLMNGYEQHAPFSIEIEPTEGCNLGCSFCGLRGIREKGTTPHKFLTLENARIIASKIADSGYSSLIIFCGHGEPTLNKNFLKILEIFRVALPKNPFMIITNGAGFKNGNFLIKDFVRRAEELEINDILLDAYSDKGDWTAIRELKREIKTIGVDNEGFRNSEKKGLRIALFPLEVKGNKKGLRKLSNHCGAAGPLDDSMRNITCVKPFRELFIRWDGNVALCCDDFRGQYFIENALNKITLKDLWNHPKFQAARIMLFNRSRTISPCLGCTCPATRAGLLPDPSAKDKHLMPPISKEVIKVFKSAYKKEGLTTIFKRPWEL